MMCFRVRDERDPEAIKGRELLSRVRAPRWVPPVPPVDFRRTDPHRPCPECGARTVAVGPSDTIRGNNFMRCGECSGMEMPIGEEQQVEREIINEVSGANERRREHAKLNERINGGRVTIDDIMDEYERALRGEE